ncbi:hypothetical protein ACIRRH_40185 [Kitasatospora sp. NPDC101235]|uniref:hypothetical protein n=1 Tax=Kitasatospora sp. NPDC101235 TaxID=3364101 RepID=UPI0038291DF7
MSSQDPFGELAVAGGQGVGGMEDAVQGLAGQGGVTAAGRTVELEQEHPVLAAQLLAELQQLDRLGVADQPVGQWGFTPGRFRGRRKRLLLAFPLPLAVAARGAGLRAVLPRAAALAFAARLHLLVAHGAGRRSEQHRLSDRVYPRGETHARMLSLL